ncbi:single-stranded DNA-binding protein [Thioalkalivibrio thiocyanodenitrificans]|uniref:single-stranded DNA-binding protein n=1 Tax=Thioalkalivibrio thiocyanodenitrificans TaxID=243063 RepID=UPI00037F522F|nr:single-stranded DNA-binding protein [Thioalkalivibrio thiocyanodenitrificans]
MKTYQKVEIAGHVGANEGIKQGREKTYCRLRVAVKDGDSTVWYTAVVFEPKAADGEIAKGAGVKISGRLSVEPYKRNDGEPSVNLTIYVQSLEVLEQSESAESAPESSSQGGDAVITEEEKEAVRPVLIQVRDGLITLKGAEVSIGKLNLSKQARELALEKARELAADTQAA